MAPTHKDALLHTDRRAFQSTPVSRLRQPRYLRSARMMLACRNRLASWRLWSAGSGGQAEPEAGVVGVLGRLVAHLVHGPHPVPTTVVGVAVAVKVVGCLDQSAVGIGGAGAGVVNGG